MVMNLKEISDNVPTGEWDYRSVVRAMFPDTGSRGVTRRSRRFAARLGRAVRLVHRQGLQGIWKVNWGYNDHQNAMMHANDSQDAVNQAQLFFGPVIGEATHRINASFVREGSPLELLNANNGMLTGFDRMIERKRKEIGALEKQIEEFETGKTFVEMYSLNCMEANIDDTETL